MDMNKATVIFAVACTLTSQVFARPASPDFKTVQNSDGSSLTIRHVGDEHYHYAETADGYLVTTDSNGNHVYVGESGTATNIVAKNSADRTAEEKAFLEKLNQEAVRAKHQELNGNRFPDAESESDFAHTPLMAYNQDGESAIRKRPTPPKWTSGERYFPVILLGTTDKPHGDSAAFHTFLNKEGYNLNGNIGSLRDYFTYSSNGKFTPHFDVYPISLDVALTSFGYNNDFNEGKLTAAGVNALTKRADFIKNADKYCSSGKYVDGFFFLFPGMEEDAMKQSSNFWGHKYSMLYNGAVTSWDDAYISNGYKFNDYAFIAQYDDGSRNSRINQMGIFAHEFSHVLGLNDVYAKINGVQYNGPEGYDVMSVGMYNGNPSGTIPAPYSSFEREALGWLVMKEAEADQVHSLKKLANMEAYSITNPNWNDEYYIVEYRPSEKYDTKLPKNGVVVWYIDYNKILYEDENAINGDASHPRLAVKKTLSSGEYYANFSFTNKNGTAPVPGVYNVVLDGNNRACFTTNKNKTLSKCPEEPASSSSVAMSSNSAVSNSSHAVAESSSSVKKNSSSSTTAINRVVASVSQVQFSQEGRKLHVIADVPGIKDVSLFDMQGHLLYAEQFSGSAATLDLAGISRSTFVIRLTAGNKTLAVKRLQ